MIRLYHGSNQEIGEIDLSRGLPDKDFGQGFYLTHLRMVGVACFAPLGIVAS